MADAWLYNETTSYKCSLTLGKSQCGLHSRTLSLDSKVLTQSIEGEGRNDKALSKGKHLFHKLIGAWLYNETTSYKCSLTFNQSNAICDKIIVVLNIGRSIALLSTQNHKLIFILMHLMQKYIKMRPSDSKVIYLQMFLKKVNQNETKWLKVIYLQTFWKK
jgi:hypothetical protein